MSGSAFLAADPGRVARMAQFGRAIATWAGQQELRPSGAAHKLGVGRPFLGDVVAGRMDPLDVAPSTAMRIIQVTGLTARYLGFEEPAEGGIKPPAFAETGAHPAPQGDARPGGAPAECDRAVAAGAPFRFGRPGSPIGAWYEVPRTVVLHLGATGSRMGEITARLSIDDCDHAIAALTQAVSAARRATARANFDREG